MPKRETSNSILRICTDSFIAEVFFCCHEMNIQGSLDLLSDQGSTYWSPLL